MTQEPINVFVENLIKEAGLEDLPEGYKEEYIEKLKTQIDRRIGIIAMENLDEAAAEKFSQLMAQDQKPSETEVQQFFAEHIPDFADKVKAGLDELVKEFVEAAKSRE